MDFRRAPTLLVLALAGCAFALTACQMQSEPPRVTRAPRTIATLLLVSESGALTAEQLQARREEVLTYLRDRGLLAADDVLVNDLAAADRIFRAVIGDSGGFKLTVFNQGSVAPDPTGVPRRVYWTNASPDPFFDAGYIYRDGPDAGYHPFTPRELPRSPNPNAPPPNYPRHDPPTTNPPPTNPPTTPPPHRPSPPRRSPDAPGDFPRRPHDPGDTPRHPRPPEGDRPPHTYTPPAPTPTPTPQPRTSAPEPSRPSAQDRDDKRDDGKPLPER